ncbi:MAG TPA: cupredoxin family copper-binding protein [Stellaceae bacterium]|nr:cupredoxin family copper-binding protein [Stellaceae bacterium]
MIVFWLGRRFALQVAATLLLALAGGLFLARHGIAATMERGAVVIDDFAFGPNNLTVKAGTTITWTNKDDEPHTVVSAADRPLFKSSALDTDDSFSFTFDKPGTYKYFCSIHPRMQGTVTVQ